MRSTKATSPGPAGLRFELVLKADSIGSVEAVSRAVSLLNVPGVDISIIKSGVGMVSQSDVLYAETAGRLIIGFQVGVMPGLEKGLREHRVEVRLYDVIYELTSDISAVAGGLTPHASEDRVLGSAKVIALYKSGRKGTIIGCRVLDGLLAVGERFRIISAMGPVYSGNIESLHIEDHAIQKAVPGQQVGIRIHDFKGARIGDLVESFRPETQGKSRVWEPTGRIILKRNS